MIILGFFFLLRPGEYAATTNPDAAPFRLSNIRLYIHDRLIDIACRHQLPHQPVIIDMDIVDQAIHLVITIQCYLHQTPERWRIDLCHLATNYKTGGACP